MAQTPLERRIRYGHPYVMPADVLSDEPTHAEDPSNLRADASCDGKCYARIIASFGDGTYLARVAASPDFQRSKGYTVVLTEAQLATARPWDGRIQAA